MGENAIRGLLKKENMVLLILGGLLLVVIAMPVKGDEAEEPAAESSYFYEVNQEASVDEYSALLEKQLEEMLSKVSEVGAVEVMITLQTIEERDQILYPKVEGVLVSCEGAGKGSVNSDITQAIQALFDLDAHKVKVLPMRAGN